MTPKETEKADAPSIDQRDVPLVELSLENVSYSPIASSVGSARSKKTRVSVLKNITTKVSPYKLTAWMGPSGSGKTSLISVAADLTRSGDIQDGSLVTVNGEEGRIPKRLVGVVWQDDLLLSNLTVEENLYFAARLKTPETIADAEVTHIVEETMAELGLSHVRNTLVGNPLRGVRGVSGGERKRVSVGAELVVRPSMLMLDEPTSGLDATTAQSLIATLKDLAKMGHSIAVVIHQPRTTIYNMFDHLLLLSKGKTLYDGAPSKARTYLESCHGALPPETGIADWMMDIVTKDEQRKNGSMLAEHWLTRTNKAEFVMDDPSSDNLDRPKPRRMDSLKKLQAAPRYNTGFLTQLKLLTHRTMKQQRGERLAWTAVILQCAYLFFTALFWWNIPDQTGSIFQKNSLFFFMIVAQANGIVISAVSVFQRERVLLSRERGKKMYTVSSFFLAKTFSDMSTNVLLPLAYSAIVYWTAGYRVSAAAFFKYVFVYYLTFSTAQSLGLLFSILIPNPQMAVVLAPPITLFFIIMAGFYIPFQDMHAGIEWASYLSFARYGYSALVISEFSDREIVCSVDDVSFSVGSSAICPFPGDNVVSSLGIHGVARTWWFNVVMVIAFQIVFRFTAYALLRRKR